MSHKKDGQKGVTEVVGIESGAESHAIGGINHGYGHT